MKKIISIFSLYIFTLSFYSQNFNCPIDLAPILKNETHLKNSNCSRNSSYWYDNNLYLPNQNRDVIYLKANFIFLTKPDGTGNFEQNNSNHQDFIDQFIQFGNQILLNLTNPSNPTCNTETPFLTSSKIQILVNKIWKIDPGWDFTLSGYKKGVNNNIYPLIPENNPNYYYSYLDNDSTIPEGVNVVFANDGEIYQRLYVEKEYTKEVGDLISQFGVAEFPDLYNLNQKSRQFYPDVFNLYTYFKEVRSVQDNISQQQAINQYKNIMSKLYFTHEFGHTLSLSHTYDCGENIMKQNSFEHNYLKPINQIGKMLRYASISNMKKYFTKNSYTNSTLFVLNNETWDLDFRLYSDISIDNQANLNLTCKLELPPQNRIRVKNNSKLKIEGADIKSANDSSWNGIEIQDTSSLEILPGTEINNHYFLAYTGSSSSSSSSSSKTIFHKESNTPSSFKNDNSFDGNKVLVYPNPLKNYLNIKILNQKNISNQVKILNITGEVIYEKLLNDNFLNLDISNFKSGIYILQISNKSNSFFKKFIKY